MQQNEERYDVVIVGAGNAALAAAVSAKENGVFSMRLQNKYNYQFARHECTF